MLKVVICYVNVWVLFLQITMYWLVLIFDEYGSLQLVNSNFPWNIEYIYIYIYLYSIIISQPKVWQRQRKNVVTNVSAREIQLIIIVIVKTDFVAGKLDKLSVSTRNQHDRLWPIIAIWVYQLKSDFFLVQHDISNGKIVFFFSFFFFWIQGTKLY